MKITQTMPGTKITDVTPDNINEYGVFCIKNLKAAGSKKKIKWFTDRYEEGLRLKIIYNEADEMSGFIEYIPGEYAWRPVEADNYIFIHCMYIYPNKNKNKGFGSMLVAECEKDARDKGMSGLAVMTSAGTWITGRELFVKNGFEQVDKRGRFELMVKKFDEKATTPRLIDWEAKQRDYKGWHLLYAQQCPWQEKSVEMMKEKAREQDIDLNVKEIKTSREARNGPSGFGVFALLHDGKLLEDHYLSERRFLTIVRSQKRT